MGDQKLPNHVVLPEGPSPEEVATTLKQSDVVKQDAEQKRQRAEDSATEAANILRRLVAALDRNPQTWDQLFGNGGS